MNSFTYKGEDFFLDGKKIVIHSGAIHYFRVPKEYWYDRLLKLKECGFNTVETYVAWNMHEKIEGQFDFSDNLDLAEFLSIANSLGLLAIVRPGPYICAEWEFGGFPWWLLKYDMKVRSHEPLYFSKLKRYIDKVFEVINPYLLDNGGNVVMMQVENEYGYYGDDKQYLKDLLSLYRTHTKSCLLFTSDWPDAYSVERGNVEGAIACGNFGSKVTEMLNNLKKIRPNQPLMCSEFWCGWFDHYYEEHHMRTAEDVCNSIEPFLQNNYNFNFYMFHGGTNFGFMNGANNEKNTGYQATVTSYDYCALLNESGDRTPAYYAVRDMIKKYGYDVPTLTATDTKKKGYGKVTFKEVSYLTDNFNDNVTIENQSPLWFEDVNLGYGYMLYRANITLKGGELKIDDLFDRATVMLDGKVLGFADRSRSFEKIVLPKTENAVLDILVENMGRTNFGEFIFEHKGIRSVTVGGTKVKNFTMILLPLEDISKIKYRDVNYSCDSVCGNVPAFYRAKLNIDEVCDTFIKVMGFIKGVVFINGKNIGRFNNYTKDGYYELDSLKTLYVPAPYLSCGENEIVIFDTDGAKDFGTGKFTCEFLDAPVL